MPKVLLSLGSNISPNAHIQWASQRLARVLSDLELSRTLWTPDISGTGVFYMNRLVSGYTSRSIPELELMLKQLEAETGRSSRRVTLDIDLMLYDGQYFHLRDWPRPYIRQLLELDNFGATIAVRPPQNI